MTIFLLPIRALFLISYQTKQENQAASFNKSSIDAAKKALGMLVNRTRTGAMKNASLLRNTPTYQNAIVLFSQVWQVGKIGRT
ncbi:MAG: hypothetical protein CSA33_02490 [Desulfobulbus propionicus]|nr:MAG: hypothetical protein CSA33_02490 [Desulfobulbus propionicus]